MNWSAASLLVIGGMLLMTNTLGCGSGVAPNPPPLPDLGRPLPGPPPEPKPIVPDHRELLLLSLRDEPIDTVETDTEFRVLLRFRFDDPQTQPPSRVRLRLMGESQRGLAIAHIALASPISEGNGKYRCEAILCSPPKGDRKFLVQADFGDRHVVAEKPITVVGP